MLPVWLMNLACFLLGYGLGGTAAFMLVCWALSGEDGL